MDDMSVKVCDICGDIGEEEKLAICSRCNDGAEHTYCMQVMIEDIPEGDWFCEECRAEVEIEEKYKKLGISQVKAGTLSSKNRTGIKHVAVTNGKIKKQSELKICRICGDIGELEKLVVCSRCTDGAEHIYCMRVMMEEVPDVGWLCEACQSELEAAKENNELQKSQVKNGVEGLPTEGKLINPANNATIRSSSKYETDVLYMGSEESVMGSQNNYKVTEKKEAEPGAASCGGQILHEPGDSPLQTDSRKRVMSRGSSFKFDVDKGKDALGRVSNSSAPNGLKNKARSDNGQLSKSNSFNNSKIPKVKQLEYGVHLRPKLSKESSSHITNRVQPMSILSMSTSFKEPNFVHPATKAKTTMKLPAGETGVINQPHIQNVKNNAGSSTAYPSVSVPMVAPVASQTESTGQCELKKPLLVRELGSKEFKRSAGFLGPDPKKKAVQASYHSLGDQNEENPFPMLKFNGYDTVRMIERSLDSPTMSSDLGAKQIASAVPESDYVWQGSFELWGTGVLPEFCDGLQGHISWFATPELREIAKKFPSKLQLRVLPRQSMWPSEFQENYPTCDRIEIFFFARDRESYENYFSKLIENIMKDDLALKGNTETAELIIFSSGILENFQRWNMLYYLWGVLRVKGEDLPTFHLA